MFSTVLRSVLSPKKLNTCKKFLNTPKIQSLCSKYLSGPVRLSENNENLLIQLENRLEQFPIVWLRDNCTCDLCFHQTSQSRIINWNTFNVNSKIKHMQNDENCCKIEWDDNHKSTYNHEWLKQRSFSKQNQEEYLNKTVSPQKTLWGKNDFVNCFKKHNFHEIISEDKYLYNWLVDLAAYGVALIKNTPSDENECRKLAERVAFIRKTHYGEEFYVKAKPGTSNVAYLSSFLQLHTDLPYYNYKPGVNLLHCLVQTKSRGGDNLLTDCFYVAEHFRKHHETEFKILSTVQVHWSDVGREDGKKFHKIHRAPVFCLDANNEMYRVNHSVPQRDSYFVDDVDLVTPWYKALRLFVDYINKESVSFKTEPGDILTFDNTRLVHGRSAYDDTESNERCIVGTYLDWDEIYSKIRVLQTESNDSHR